MKLGIFIFGGIVLIVSGILQVFVRPRAENETPLQRVVNGATVRAVFFGLVGVLAILVGTGVIPIVPMGP
ncbi:MAG TPA: hypothetical protein VGF45_21550 [Polyangia bacterium]